MRTGPDYIQFYPTLRCNQACGFCFNQALVPMPDMSLADFHRMLVRLPAAVRSLDIIGGEPTLHPELVPLIAAARSAGLTVNLSSNGSNLAVLDGIVQSEPDVAIGLSVNDHWTLDRLRDFIETGRPVVKTVCSGGSDQALARDILLLRPKTFYYIYRDAAGHGDLSETLSFPRYLHAVSCLGLDRRFAVFCSGFLPDTETYPALAAVRCPAGTTKLGIMPDGSVYPCNLLFGKHRFLLGNILTDPFESIWSHPALAFFRTFTGNSCPERTCSVHAGCHGGCPAQSLLLCGDLAAPDPRCARMRP